MTALLLNLETVILMDILPLEFCTCFELSIQLLAKLWINGREVCCAFLQGLGICGCCRFYPKHSGRVVGEHHKDNRVLQALWQNCCEGSLFFVLIVCVQGNYQVTSTRYWNDSLWMPHISPLSNVVLQLPPPNPITCTVAQMSVQL